MAQQHQAAIESVIPSAEELFDSMPPGEVAPSVEASRFSSSATNARMSYIQKHISRQLPVSRQSPMTTLAVFSPSPKSPPQVPRPQQSTLILPSLPPKSNEASCLCDLGSSGFCASIVRGRAMPKKAAAPSGASQTTPSKKAGKAPSGAGSPEAAAQNEHFEAIKTILAKHLDTAEDIQYRTSLTGKQDTNWDVRYVPQTNKQTPAPIACFLARRASKRLALSRKLSCLRNLGSWFAIFVWALFAQPDPPRSSITRS